MAASDFAAAWPVVAIDGPSGSGKGTVAGILAKRLGWNLLDSGALYRLLAFAAGNHGIDLTNEEALKGKGVDCDMAALTEEIRARDERDSQRSVAPLKPAEGAIVVDSTSMSIEAVVDSILGEVERLGLTD